MGKGPEAVNKLGPLMLTDIIFIKIMNIHSIVFSIEITYYGTINKNNKQIINKYEVK